MIQTKLNPLVATMLTLIVCVASGLVVACFIGNGAELAAVMYTVYITPVVCLFVFNALLVANKSWRRRNIPMLVLVDLILIGWIVTVIIHIRNLFD